MIFFGSGVLYRIGLEAGFRPATGPAMGRRGVGPFRAHEAADGLGASGSAWMTDTPSSRHSGAVRASSRRERGGFSFISTVQIL
jgi:hypothetical protein